MSNTPVIKNETSPLSSEVSSNSTEDSSLAIHDKTQLDLMLEMLVKMKSDMKANQEELNLRLTRLEEKKSPGGSPRDKVSSSLFVDVVNTEWDQVGRSITHSTPGPP